MMEVLREQGVENPTIKLDTTVNRLKTITGELNDEGNIPIEIDFENTTNDQLKSLFPNGIKIYGETDPDEFPRLDSVAAEGADESIKKIFLQTVQSMISQFNFPAKKIKVGKSFRHKVPISIPVLNRSMEMEITSIYTLISVENGLAYFDITQEFIVTSDIDDLPLTATGQGEGKIVYDIAFCFFSDYEVTSEMKMSITKDFLTVNITQQSNVKQVTSISK